MARLMSTAEVARYLSVSVRTVERYRANGTGPAYLVIGHQIRYHPTAVTTWLRTQQQQPAKEPRR